MRFLLTAPWILSLLTLSAWLSFALDTDSAPAAARHRLYKSSEDGPLHQLVKRYPQLDESSGSKGTKDAPVDGADGKPHAGPFVDFSDSSKASKGSKKQSKPNDKVEPEDGVMNDPHRKPPKKGTTGTEGGVSEKSKTLEAHENETGEKKAQKPASPKDAGSIPHKEETSDTSKKVDKPKSSKGNEKSAPGPTKSEDKNEKPKGAMSIEKPNDLPDKPHDYPIPGTPPRKSDGKPDTKGKTSSKDNMDASKESDDSDDEEQDGVHDLIRWDSLFGSFTSIAATEIGDKTFIVAALMAMRHPKIQVFTAAFSALFVMTILSGITGHAVGAVISKKWSALLAAALFLVFGAKSLKEGAEMDPNQGASEEIQEVQAELEEKEVDMARANGHKRISSLSPDVLEAGRVERSRSRSRLAPAKRSPSTSPSPARKRPTVSSAIAGIKNLLSLVLSPAWVETFSMTFVGELGDRSQIATVAMAAGQEYYWIMVGATLGHCVCTAGAVLGGSALAGRISMRTVTLGGGFIFVGFGLFTLYEAIQYFH